MRMIGFLLLLSCGAYAMSQDTPYFPIKKKAGDPGISGFEARWYGKSLGRMNEPRLPEIAKDSKAVVYRFTILPTWGNPIAVRARKEGNAFSLSARRLDGEGGYDPGTLVEQKEVKLTEADSAALEALIAKIGFFQMATDDDVRGNDGAQWILEGVAEGKHQVVQRWEAQGYDPEKRGLESFLALCTFLVDKSTLSERPKNNGHEILPGK